MLKPRPRSIAVVDVGFTNTKIVQFDDNGQVLRERKMASAHREGEHYREIDPEPLWQFCKAALRELDALTPIDVIVPCAHGAAIACLNNTGNLALPIMNYTSEPPVDIISEYEKRAPAFEECFGPTLPMALTQGLQLYWQHRVCPEAFSKIATILPWIQYVAFRLSGVAVSEVSGMSCQSQLMNITTDQPSSLAINMGWAVKFAPRAKAWETIGHLLPDLAGHNFRGEARVLAGVHDSTANYLRYQAAGLGHFTLLSTGTWIIGFDEAAQINILDHTLDTVTNTDVFGRAVACCRFFGGREFEVLSQGADGGLASLKTVQQLVDDAVFALPSFTDSGGPMPGTGNAGKIIGPFQETPENRASLATLYCALMVCQSLNAIDSKHAIIVDGPFAKNSIFMLLLAALRQHQAVFASELRDGTTAGAACLAMMPDGQLPKIATQLFQIAPPILPNLVSYAKDWRHHAENVSP